MSVRPQYLAKTVTRDTGGFSASCSSRHNKHSKPTRRCRFPFPVARHMCRKLSSYVAAISKECRHNTTADPRCTRQPAPKTTQYMEGNTQEEGNSHNQ